MTTSSCQYVFVVDIAGLHLVSIAHLRDPSKPVDVADLCFSVPFRYEGETSFVFWGMDEPFEVLKKRKLLAGRCVIFNVKEVEDEWTPRRLGFYDMPTIPTFFIVRRKYIRLFQVTPCERKHRCFPG